MLDQFLQQSDLGLFVLRIAVGIVFLYHAFPKLKNAREMAKMMGAPAEAIFILGLVELLGTLGLVSGFYLQGAALALGVVMAGAIGMKMIKWRIPFAAVDKTGWEFDFTLLAANVALILTGGGSISFF